jgi:hypothetical protein
MPDLVIPDPVLDHFRAKRIPIRARKTHQNKKLELCSDSIASESAVAFSDRMDHSVDKKSLRIQKLELILVDHIVSI